MNTQVISDISHKTMPIEGIVTKILPATEGTNERGTYRYQPIIIEWNDTYDQGNDVHRTVTNRVKVSLTGNVITRVNIQVGQHVKIPFPQYVVVEKNSFYYQNVNASFIEILQK